MKSIRTLSKAEFERLSHPEKLDYLTALLDAVKAPDPKKALPEDIGLLLSRPRDGCSD